MIGRTAQQAKVTAPEVHGPSLGVSDKLFPHTAPLLHGAIIVCDRTTDNNVDLYQLVEMLMVQASELHDIPCKSAFLLKT